MVDFNFALVTFLSAVAGSLLATPLVIRLASRNGVGGVPRVGGAAVLSGFAIGVAFSLWYTGYSGSLLRATRYHWIGWILAALLLFAGGVIDDLRGLGPWAKLAIQCAGAFAIFMAGFRVDFIRLPGQDPMTLGWLSLPVTVLWVVGVTNALNLIDGLDGLATGIALLSTATIAIISYTQEVFPVTVIAIALAGSLLGFLRYNFNPARIILGDSGSQFLGFTLAVISIRGLQKSATAVAILVPILVLGLPILDMILVVLRRGWRIGHAAPGSAERSRWTALVRGDREHIHHNLLELGFSQRRAALVLYAAAALFCATALGLVYLREPALALFVALATAVAATGVKFAAVRSRR